MRQRCYSGNRMHCVTLPVLPQDFVAAFEQNEAAQQKLMVSLLAAFDARSWVNISGILLRLTKGGGFGQVR